MPFIAQSIYHLGLTVRVVFEFVGILARPASSSEKCVVSSELVLQGVTAEG